MLALRAVYSPTVLRTSSSCLRLPLRSRLPALSASAPYHYEKNLQARLFSVTTLRLLPRVPHSNPQEQSDSRQHAQAPAQSETESDGKSTNVPTFLSELEKEEETRFAHDAARFRAQTGIAPAQGWDSLSGARAEDSARPPPKFRAEVLKEDPTFEQPRFEDGVGRPGIWKQVAFAGLVTMIVFGNAAELTNFDTKRLSAVFPSPFMVTSEQLRRVRLSMLSEKLKKTLQKLKEHLSGLPNSLTYPFLWSYVQLANGYINASEGKRIAYQICAINAVVWLMWQVRALRPFMKANFTHHPLSGRYITLLTSIFSHESFIHLLANSFALISFGSAATTYLVKRQHENKEGTLESTPKYHFWAVFVGAGLFSSLTSHIVSTRILFPRLLAELRASKAANIAASTTSAFRRVGSSAKDKAAARSGSPKDILPSLGASGAIYATVTMTALAYPDAQVFLLFPPIPLPITWGVGGMVALDVIGILRGWRLFDHWAHLSGAAFGVLYYKYGPDMWNALRANHARRVQAANSAK